MTTTNTAVAPAGARTFRAPSMAAALTVIQSELGPEALIVSVRQVPGGQAWQVWRKPEVEVVAMAAAPARLPAPPRAPEVAPAPLTAPRSAEDFAKKAAQIKALLAEMTEQRRAAGLAPETPTRTAELVRAPGAPAAAPAAGAASETLTTLERQLLEQGVAAELVSRALADGQASLSPRFARDAARLREAVAQQLEANPRVWGSGVLARPAAPGAAPRVVCLVGPTGSGKTTAIGKLAAHHVRAHGLRVSLICADTYRAGAIAQERVYAEALKLNLRVAYTGAELAQAVAAEQGADLVLVDTPGCNPRREADLAELGGLLTALRGRATYLVAPATAKDCDLQDALAAFGVFDLKGLLLTKLDETGTFGNLYNLAWRSRLPLLYFGFGASALEDLEAASATRLVNAVLGLRPEASG